MSTEKRDVQMIQQADIKMLLNMPIIREFASREQSGGLTINTIGPIYVSNTNNTEELNQPMPVHQLAEARKGPVLLRGVSSGIELPEKTVAAFEKVYDNLPTPKLDATVRLVVETAHRRDPSPKAIARELDCSHYKAKSLMDKYGLTS